MPQINIQINAWVEELQDDTLDIIADNLATTIEFYDQSFCNMYVDEIQINAVE